MNFSLKYGKNGLSIDFDDSMDITLVEPKEVTGVKDPEALLRSALRAPVNMPPLSECADASTKVGIIFCDITRATPSAFILPIVLDELSNVPKENITLFNATGTHRENTDDELRVMVGDSIVDNYRIIQNDCNNISTQKKVGTTSFGHETWINAELAACDLIIMTGFIEPHFFAGFSGGGKAIMPGMAGKNTIFGNHDAKMIADAKSTWGITNGNPIWEEIQEVAEMSGKLFLVNVTLNKQHQLTGAYCGELRKAHAEGCAFVKQTAMAPVEQAFDVVVTTNSGYPLDMNLYQSVKGMSAAAQIVKPGGAIIIATECSDGIPDHGLFRKLLNEAESAEAVLSKICSPGFLEQDQWQVQVMTQILTKARIYVYSSLDDQVVRNCLLEPTHDIAATCRDLATNGKICVMPQGPLTIPYIA